MFGRLPDLHALRRQGGTIAAAAFAALTLLAMSWRVLHGIDFSDESFYVALPLRFALGDQPFVDELNVAQTAGLLLYPFVKAYTTIAGTAGIFFFLRLLFLAFFACVGWSAYGLARPYLPRPAALLIATACICFIPYGAPGLGYNTISMGLFSIGLFSSARWLLAEEHAAPRRLWKVPLYQAGLLHAAACLAYPSLVLTVLGTAACVTALARGRRRQALLLYAAGGGSFLLLLSPVFAAAGLHNVRAVLAYTGGGSLAATFGLAALSERFTVFLVHHPELSTTLLSATAGVVAARWWPRLATLGLAVALPLLVRGTILGGYVGSLGFVAGFALLGPILTLGIRDRRLAAVLAIGVIAPSLLHGVVMSLSSGNGSLAAAIGLFPAAIATAIALAVLVDQAFHRSPGLRPVLALAPALFVGLLARYTTAPDSYYLDGPSSALTERVDRGPFWGLYTTKAKLATLEQLSADLLAHRGGPQSRLYCNMPAGYIIAERRPLVASAWIFPSPSKASTDARFFLERARPGDLIVFGDEYNHQLKKLIPLTAEPIARRPAYSLLTYRGFGELSAQQAAAVPPLPLDEWQPLFPDKTNEALLGFGWSWPEEWGRWSDGYYASLILPRPTGDHGAPRDLLVKLEVLPHLAPGHRRQRYRARIAGQLIGEGVVPRAGGILELVVPARLQSRSALYLWLELPDAFASPDTRIIGLGLQRVMLSYPPAA